MSWLAVRSGGTDALLQRAGLKKTGETAFCLDEPITLGHLPTGWDVILFDREELTGRQAWLAEISKGDELMVGFVEEHVMYSRLSFWKNGDLLWDIHHDAQKDITHLQVTGNPPVELNDIRESLLEKQKRRGTEDSQTDYVFDVPTTLSRVLTGYKHDETIEGFDDENCEVLSGKIPDDAPRKKPSLFQRLFGSK